MPRTKTESLNDKHLENILDEVAIDLNHALKEAGISIGLERPRKRSQENPKPGYIIKSIHKGRPLRFRVKLVSKTTIYAIQLEAKENDGYWTFPMAFPFEIIERKAEACDKPRLGEMVMLGEDALYVVHVGTATATSISATGIVCRFKIFSDWQPCLTPPTEEQLSAGRIVQYLTPGVKVKFVKCNGVYTVTKIARTRIHTKDETGKEWTFSKWSRLELVK